jgi:hypothetical protein
MLSFFDFEPSEDGGDTGAAAPPSGDGAAADTAGGASPEPVPSPAGATEGAAAPAFAPEQIEALRSDPGFQEWMAEEAASIADARFSQLLEHARGQQPQPQPQGDGGQVNLNEFLDPMGDNFGENLMHVLGLMSRGITETVDARFQPFSEQQEQARAAERDDLLKSAITDTAGTLGGLKGGEVAVDRVMAAVRTTYMPQAAALYGQTDRAAQVAIEKAIRAELEYQREVSGAAAGDTANHLALVHNAPNGVNGVGAAAVAPTDGAILSDRELIAKYSGLAAAIRGH